MDAVLGSFYGFFVQRLCRYCRGYGLALLGLFLATLTHAEPVLLSGEVQSRTLSADLAW